MLNVLLIGSGAREHAIAWKLLLSPKVKELFVAPGNGGTALIARNLDIPARDIRGLADAALTHGINLAIIGPEEPLALGIVDAFQSLGIPTFGPSQRAAQIEASKLFAKELMLKHGIPCAKGKAFNSPDEAKSYAASQPLPVVVKADGLAAGKGVTVARSHEEASAAIDQALVQRVFGQAGDRVLVEEFLSGREVSLLCFSDGKTVVPMVPACDYKPVFDGDEGPNTGGMGCYSPSGFFGPEMVDLVKTDVLEAVVRGMAAEGIPYKGILYAGLMVTAEGPKVLEFNCRFGDPETQAILPRLNTDLVDIVEAVIAGTLDQIHVEWSEEKTVGVVLASGGYPGKYSTGQAISGLDSLDAGVRVFHAGTRLVERPAPSSASPLLLSGRQPKAPITELVTDGGRVLTVVANGRTIGEARRKAYANVRKIQFNGCHFRTDVGAREAGHEEALQPEPGAKPSGGRTGAAGNAEDARFVSQCEFLIAAGKERQAIELLEKMLRYQPDLRAARAALGTAYAACGNLDAALGQWQEVANRFPGDAEARHNLGSLHLRQGKLEMAVDEMNEAIRIDRSFVPAYLGLGAILAKRGQYEKAATYYEMALQIDPKSPDAHLDFALILADMGRRNDALVEVQSCFEANPGPETRREAEQLQKKLTRRGWF
ncbi:MAG: phosphoribosylamine--glycine ligase [Chloroflexi bacterium]|nr:phosphoribosylamine--glycine ligase [Chloroflexota bacterium]